jgi:hypothetical protein
MEHRSTARALGGVFSGVTQGSIHAIEESATSRLDEHE